MRIIAGSAGGRKLLVPKDDRIRPTGDKVRGAIFNSLRSRGVVQDAVVLDCFCGTGALGLEALSQGAASCIFVDNSKESLDLAKQNAAALGFVERSKFVFSDARKLKKPSESVKAGLAFLDPPYEKGLVAPTLEALYTGERLEKDAVVIVEAEKNFKEVIPTAFKALDEKIYGDTKVLFLQFVM